MFQCVTCGEAEAGTIFATGWQCERGGRLCPGCARQLAAAPDGASAGLGGGWRLVKTPDQPKGAR